jgi:hypothetical protein
MRGASTGGAGTLDCGNDPIGRVARDQGFVLTAGQLWTAGWVEHDLKRERRRGKMWLPARGVACPIPIQTGADAFLLARRRHALRATAAVLTHRGHLIGARSAAIVHGLPTLSVPPDPELISPRRAQDPRAVHPTTGRRTASAVRVSHLPESERTTWYGAPVLSAARTVTEIARTDRRAGLVTADAALFEGLVTADELTASIRRWGARRGVARAREVVSLARAGGESPLESLIRLALHDDGFPEPELQVVIHDPERGRQYRVDLLLREQGLIIETDGLLKYDGPGGRDALRREKIRETRLVALGYRVVRILWDDVVRYWPQTAARLWGALGRS